MGRRGPRWAERAPRSAPVRDAASAARGSGASRTLVCGRLAKAGFGLGLGLVWAHVEQAMIRHHVRGGYGTYQSLVLLDFIRNVHLRYSPAF